MDEPLYASVEERADPFDEVRSGKHSMAGPGGFTTPPASRTDRDQSVESSPPAMDTPATEEEVHRGEEARVVEEEQQKMGKEETGPAGLASVDAQSRPAFEGRRMSRIAQPRTRERESALPRRSDVIKARMQEMALDSMAHDRALKETRSREGALARNGESPAQSGSHNSIASGRQPLRDRTHEDHIMPQKDRLSDIRSRVASRASMSASERAGPSSTRDSSNHFSQLEKIRSRQLANSSSQSTVNGHAKDWDSSSRRASSPVSVLSAMPAADRAPSLLSPVAMRHLDREQRRMSFTSSVASFDYTRASAVPDRRASRPTSPTSIRSAIPYRTPDRAQLHLEPPNKRRYERYSVASSTVDRPTRLLASTEKRAIHSSPSAPIQSSPPVLPPTNGYTRERTRSLLGPVNERRLERLSLASSIAERPQHDLTSEDSRAIHSSPPVLARTPSYAHERTGSLLGPLSKRRLERLSMASSSAERPHVSSATLAEPSQPQSSPILNRIRASAQKQQDSPLTPLERIRSRRLSNASSTASTPDARFTIASTEPSPQASSVSERIRALAQQKSKSPQTPLTRIRLQEIPPNATPTPRTMSLRSSIADTSSPLLPPSSPERTRLKEHYRFLRSPRSSVTQEHNSSPKPVDTQSEYGAPVLSSPLPLSPISPRFPQTHEARSSRLAVRSYRPASLSGASGNGVAVTAPEKSKPETAVGPSTRAQDELASAEQPPPSPDCSTSTSTAIEPSSPSHTNTTVSPKTVRVPQRTPLPGQDQLLPSNERESE